MENRIRRFEDDQQRREERGGGPKPMNEILGELLAQYEVRFPRVHFTIVETPATVI